MRRGRGALTFAEAGRDSAGTRSTRNSESRVSRYSPSLPWENPMQSGNSRRIARDVSFPSRDSLRGILLVIRALHRNAGGRGGEYSRRLSTLIPRVHSSDD